MLAEVVASRHQIGLHGLDHRRLTHLEPDAVRQRSRDAKAELEDLTGRAVDWFDDDFFLYYEDTDLSWRLRADGWNIRYEPTARLRHLHSASSVEWSPLWMFHVDRNRLLMLTKNASAPLARRAVRDYLLTSAAMAVGACRSTSGRPRASSR